MRSLTYDAEENVVHYRDSERDITIAYRGMNRLGVREENGQRVEFTYDSEEDLTGIVNEHGYVYRFGLDARGQVVSEAG